MTVNNNVNSTRKKKRVSADDAAAQYLEVQMSLKGESRFSNLLLIILTMGFIFTFAVMFWVIPDKDFSAEENRALATMPELSFENLLSGNLTDEFTDYMADQFPFRNFFVGTKALSETVQLKGQNNDVIIGSDGYLIARNDYPDEDILKDNISSAARFAAACEKEGIEVTASFAGRKMDVCDDKLPQLYGSYYADRIWNILDDMCAEDGLDYINLRDVLREHEAAGESVYYKGDHHWNSYGAYIAYREIMKEFGEEPYPIDEFEKEAASTDFYGTTWSSAGVKWAKPDAIDYYRWDGDESFTMRVIDEGHSLEGRGCTYENIDGKDYAVFDSYFVRDFLGEKDKYASFIGGNFGYTEITKNGEDRETLLILKDSFSHSTVQFLARHYNLIMVDLRYYKTSMLRFCKENNIDRVLMLYNMETLTEGSYLKVLNSGLGAN